MNYLIHYIKPGETQAMAHAFPAQGRTTREVAEEHASKIEGEAGARLVVVQEGVVPRQVAVFTLERASAWKLV